MSLFNQVSISFLIAVIISCNNQPNSKGLINATKSNSTIIDTPRSFVKNYGTNNNDSFFAFVGEKISVEPLPYRKGSMDGCFKGKYLILKKVYGNFIGDTIEFVAYDHYGIPEFSKYKNVLLYVSADKGTYFHEKYMYNDVYKTKDGRWAGSYAAYDYNHVYNKHTTIKPEKIGFIEKVAYSTKFISDIQYSRLFPKQYFKIIGDTAYAIYGNYLEDLFELKKNGVLTFRRLFKATPEQEGDFTESFLPMPEKGYPNADDLKFLKFWKTFVSSLNEPGLNKFKTIALDNLVIFDNIISVDTFITKYMGEVIDSDVRKCIIDKKKFVCSSTKIAHAELRTSDAKNEIRTVHNNYRIREMHVARSVNDDNPPVIQFNFIETEKGYRLYGIDHHWVIIEKYYPE